jgi:hypothetical protein
MRVRSLHPGVTIDNVAENTGFELAAPDDIPLTRDPTADEMRLIAELDPDDRRGAEL